MINGLLTFIIIFGIIVLIHEFGHFYFAKKSGILVREFSVGMGPKIFSHIGKDGTAYTIRILPLGGYVRMAGWGEDKTEIKTGTPVSLSLNEAGQVVRVNLSSKKRDQKALPMNVTAYDFEDKLEITGLVMDESKTFSVDHDATIIEEDGTEIRIAPLDVQYQNASIGGRLITNFAGPMNNFILTLFAFWLLIFLQGGVENPNSNQFNVVPNSALAKAGVKDGETIDQLGSHKISNWDNLVKALDQETKGKKDPEVILSVTSQTGDSRQVTVKPEKQDGDFKIGVMPGMSSKPLDMILGGFSMTWQASQRIILALKELITHPNLNGLGGPVAVYKASSDAAKNGFRSSLSLLAFLSINIGIFNLLPIPALDGGKIVLNILELIRRKPLKQETETYVTLVGVAIMVLLMLAVTWNDIVKTFF